MNISKDTLPGYEEKIKTFYMEHIHADEEIRFILDGSGACTMRAGTCLGGGIITCVKGACTHMNLPQNLRQTYSPTVQRSLT